MRARELQLCRYSGCTTLLSWGSVAGMGRDDQRRMLREVAETVAPGWERWRAFIEGAVAPVRGWMITELAPRPGDTVLELAAGAGDTGFAAAAIVGARGRLISTDLSPAMVEVARRRAAELGLEGVEHRVVDAEQIPLEDDSVDGVLCRFGFMLMPDPVAALGETRRVLRSGGRAALAVWGAPEGNPWFSILARALVERGHMPPPEPGAASPFSMGSQERTRELLEGAGFGSVRTAEVPVLFSYRDLDHYLSVAGDTAGPAVIAMRRLSERERGALAAHLREAFAPFATGPGYALPGVAVAAVAS
jgi:ubiquinone/menaquinone biosynthesis C-methylase UbiE